jgi:cytochrome c-type biogenesis protein CcmH
MARNMSIEVRDLMAAGYDQKQVLAYFESSYGEFVLLQPPLRGVNWLVWLAPAIALILGGTAVFFALRKMTKKPGAGEAVDTGGSLESEPVDPELERYLAAARNLAADGPEAKPPAAGPSKATN